MSPTYRSSRADSWTYPRAHSDESSRRRAHGPIQPMEQSGGFLSRLFGLR